jgi:hypothetical protein
MTEAFVYLWQDARQKPYKYYLGYHKGSPDDGYTHSSSVFESFSKDNIPNRVRRRILATGSTEEMMELENKLLNNRKDSKWDRYYNIITNFPPNMWDDPEYQKMMSEKMGKMVKKQWQDPEYRKMQSEKLKKQWQDPEYRKMKSEQMTEKAKKLWQDPEYRKMQSEVSKELWKDPKFRKMKSDEMSEQNKKQWNDPDHRKKMSEQMKKKATCDVCGFVSNRANIGKWHNDNCKHKNEK